MFAKKLYMLFLRSRCVYAYDECSTPQMRPLEARVKLLVTASGPVGGQGAVA